MRAFAILALACLALAGCATPDTNPAGPSGHPAASVPDQWWVHALPSSATDAEHDHGNRSQHLGITTPNFQVVGWDPLVTQRYGTTLTGMGCGGAVTRADGKHLAVVHSISTQVSFVVADITDPTAPRMLGEYYLPNAVVWDADISADGNHVLIGAYPPGPLFGRDPTLPPGLASGTAAATGVADGHAHSHGFTGPTTPAPLWALPGSSRIQMRDACTGEVKAVGPDNYLPGPAIVMVGIQDPTTPTFESYMPQPVIGPHSVGSQLIDGVLYATSSVTNLVHEGSYYTVYTIANDQLLPYSAIQTPGIPAPTALNGHTDIYLQKHPVTGKLLGYLANWDALYVFDLSLPGTATQVSTWGDAGSVHTTYPFPHLVDGKQLLVVGQEVGEPSEASGLPSGWVYILDVTDPAKPTELGRWTLPVKPAWDDGGLQFSPHYVAILNDTLFVANYHGGLWAVDIADVAAPAAMGIFVPERESPKPFGGAATYGPSIEDVVVDQATGLVTTWDNSGGVYTLHFDHAMPAPRAPRWPGSEPK